MIPLVFLAAGFAPGMFWLWRIYLRNRHRPDPKNLVVRTFILGAVAAIPIAIFERIIAPEGGLELAKGNATKVAYYAFVVAGVTEELGKFLVVRWSLFASPYLKEAMSGMVFGS